MKLDSLHELWAEDQTLDLSKPDQALRSIPLLHAKWWKIYTDERQRYMAAKQDLASIRHKKFDWYLGRMDPVECKALGWPLQHLRIVRQEVDTYLANDTDLIPLAAKVELAEAKLKMLEGIIKQIDSRGFLVNTYVNYLKWSQGA